MFDLSTLDNTWVGKLKEIYSSYRKNGLMEGVANVASSRIIELFMDRRVLIVGKSNMRKLCIYLEGKDKEHDSFGEIDTDTKDDKEEKDTIVEDYMIIGSIESFRMHVNVFSISPLIHANSFSNMGTEALNESVYILHTPLICWLRMILARRLQVDDLGDEWSINNFVKAYHKTIRALLGNDIKKEEEEECLNKYYIPIPITMTQYKKIKRMKNKIKESMNKKLNDPLPGLGCSKKNFKKLVKYINKDNDVINKKNKKKLESILVGGIKYTCIRGVYISRTPIGIITGVRKNKEFPNIGGKKDFDIVTYQIKLK